MNVLLRLSPTLRTIFGLFFAVLLSAAVWALSPWLTGHAEPWDDDSLYYVVALFVSGVVSGLLIPTPRWIHYVGAVVGQMMFMLLVVGSGPLIFFGVGVVFLCALLFLCGAWFGSFFAGPPQRSTWQQ